MRKWLQVAMITTVGSAMLSSGVVTAELDDAVELRVASFRQGSSWYVYGVTLGELLRRHLPAGSQVDTPPLGGGTANPSLVAEGKADIGLGFAVVNRWAREGSELFDEPRTELRGLMGGLDQYYLGMVANATDAGPTLGEYVNDQKSETRVILLRKGSFGSYAGEQALQEVGADQATVEGRGGSYTFTDFGTVKSAFPAGRTDLFIQVMTRGHPAITEIAETTDVTFLEPGEDTLGALMDNYGWGRATLPPGVFRGQERALELPGTTTSVIVSAQMSDDLAYTIVRTVCENQDSFRGGHGALANFDCASEAWREDNIGLPLHSGAARYYREQGWLE